MRRPAPISLVLRMYRWALSACLCLCFSPAPAHAWQAKRDVKRQIEMLENQWRTAQLAGDLPTMDHMLSDDYVGITMTGQITTKSQQMARFRSGALMLTRLDMQDVKIKLADQVAIVTVKARVEGTSGPKRLDGEYRYTRIYHQLASGAWKITNFEASRIGHRHDGAAEARSGQAG